MSKMEEIIIITPRVRVFPDESKVFQGSEKNKDIVNEIFENIEKEVRAMKRGHAETNPTYKQLIPYGVIKRGDQIFTYERLSGGGDERLHGNLSIGVGGHMNPTHDDTLMNMIFTNLMREINEEISIEGQFIGSEVIGLINDDSNEVGKVHLGVLVVLELPEEATIEINEVDSLEGKFVDIKQLKTKKIYGRLENWSKIAVDIL